MSFTKKIVDEVLVACRRSCCICNKYCGVRIETHHIRPKSKGGDDSFENCIPLCLDCHAEVEHYNSDHPIGRKFSENELRKHRDNWYMKAADFDAPPKETTNRKCIAQLISGNANMVAGRDLNITTKKVVNKAVVQVDPGGKHIDNTTARKIQELVKECVIIYEKSGKDPGWAAKRTWGRLKKEFNVTSYKEIPIEESEKAINWLCAEIAMTRPRIRRKDPEAWRQTFYKPIYARANDFNMSKEELYHFATSRLQLKRLIKSLKDLSQANLEKLHYIMISEAKKRK